MSTENQTSLAAEFKSLSAGAQATGSPLYGDLAGWCAEDVNVKGAVWTTLGSHAHLPQTAALSLRFFGALHRLALAGAAPELAAHYPSCGGKTGSGLHAAFLATVIANRDEIIGELDWPLQTNEVGRAAALYPGLVHIAGATNRSIVVCEIGASAGLNLHLDRFAYRDGSRTTGSRSSSVCITDRWSGHPPLDDLRIVGAAGCDPSPIDVATAEGRARILGFVWPDQHDRHRDTAAAIGIARSNPRRLDRAQAIDWLRSEFAERSPSSTTVVMHSVVWPYITIDEQHEVNALVEATGQSATSDAPVAWLSFEPPVLFETTAILTLRLWDGNAHVGRPIKLAESGMHGQWVRWLCPFSGTASQDSIRA